MKPENIFYESFQNQGRNFYTGETPHLSFNYELSEPRIRYGRPKKLGIFVDESGNTGGDLNTNSLWYIITMVFSETDNLSQYEDELEMKFSSLGHSNHCFHTSPLIHGDSYYEGDSLGKRRRIMACFLSFLNQLPVSHVEFCVEKKNLTEYEIHEHLTKQVYSFIYNNFSYFMEFDNITIYYDNGQQIVMEILEETVHTLLPSANIEIVKPKYSRLFQIADLICSLKWLSIKSKTIGLTYKENYFFGGDHVFKRNFLRVIQKKEFPQTMRIRQKTY